MKPKQKCELLDALTSIRAFVPRSQYMACAQVIGQRGEGADELQEPILRLKQIIDTMPKTYEQEGLGDAAIAHIHYFAPSADWHITEQDVDGCVDQAFGLANLGYGAELGYISIRELCSVRTVEIDFYFKPRALKEIREKSAA